MLKVKVQLFLSLFFLVCYLISYQILWRWAPENDEDPGKNIFKTLDMNFISIKNMRWKSANFCISSKGTPAPLNIPTPTLAPDQGGPVACHLSGRKWRLIIIPIICYQIPISQAVFLTAAMRAHG